MHAVTIIQAMACQLPVKSKPNPMPTYTNWKRTLLEQILLEQYSAITPAPWRLKSSVTRLMVQRFVWAELKENIRLKSKTTLKLRITGPSW